MIKYRFLVIFFIFLIASVAAENSKIEAKGSYAPAGPPSEKPMRINAGIGCIIELNEPYNVKGTLSGTFEINYRILVHGPCGKPIGTYDEEWIAYGSFKGLVNGISKSGKFTYTANVKAGGDVKGAIVFGQGFGGELSVQGNFHDGNLKYDGWVD
jgi:hypothetical protein